jgi:hypothetical protein
MKLKAPLIAAIGALLLVGALFLSLFLSTAAYRPDESQIAYLSGQAQPSETDKIAGRNMEIMGGVQIDPNNVQRVIASLSRAESYIATVTSRLYYGETSGIRVSRLSVRNGAHRIDHLSQTGTAEYTELLYNGVYYAWRNGAGRYYQGVQGDFTTDQQAMLPTYETVCALPPEQIIGAALVQEGEELFITVDTQDGTNIGIYKISVQTGLLRTASFSQDGKMTRAVDVAVSAEQPLDALFILPGEFVPVYGTENKLN